MNPAHIFIFIALAVIAVGWVVAIAELIKANKE